MAMRKLAVTIILPCYNEGPTFEKSVEKLVSQIKNSRAIYHSKNQGRGKSVADGIKTAKGEICGFLDVDLEVSADYIPSSRQALVLGYGNLCKGLLVWIKNQ